MSFSSGKTLFYSGKIICCHFKNLKAINDANIRRLDNLEKAICKMFFDKKSTEN